MIDELLSFMNHGDVEEGIFAVGEISQEDVNNWIPQILMEDFSLSLVSWSSNELEVAHKDGTTTVLAFDGEKWVVRPDGAGATYGSHNS